jgi:hypothetical protein
VRGGCPNPREVRVKKPVTGIAVAAAAAVALTATFTGSTSTIASAFDPRSR